jgi:ATP-dependent helicase/DNAse subunit B
LKFYFRYVAGIREAREVEDDLDARILGNFLHRVMEKFYLNLVNEKGSMKVEAEDLRARANTIDKLLDEVFIESYHLDPGKAVVYEGQRVVVKEVVKRFAAEILKKDLTYAPFEIVGLETRERTYAVRLPLEGNPEVLLGGSIDRADKKNDVIRVIDYKTGRDDIDFEGAVSDLLNRGVKRNKAAFQTMMYALLFQKNAKPYAEQVKLLPGLMNRRNLFEDNFTFGLKKDKVYVQDATPLLTEFEQSLTITLTEIYDPAIPFNQTDKTETCQWCPYREICCR